MARGDLTVFEETKKFLLMGGWEAADEIWIGLVTNDPAVAANADTPAYATGGNTDYTAIATAGEYASGGLLLDTWTAMIVESAGTVTCDDTGASVTWAQNASNPETAMFAVIYNDTQANYCIAMIDLDGAIDMTAGALTITWNASGIFTFV